MTLAVRPTVSDPSVPTTIARNIALHSSPLGRRHISTFPRPEWPPDDDLHQADRDPDRRRPPAAARVLRSLDAAGAWQVQVRVETVRTADETLRIPLLGGRDFTERDNADAPPVSMSSAPQRSMRSSSVECASLEIISLTPRSRAMRACVSHKSRR